MVCRKGYLDILDDRFVLSEKIRQFFIVRKFPVSYRSITVSKGNTRHPSHPPNEQSSNAKVHNKERFKPLLCLACQIMSNRIQSINLVTRSKTWSEWPNLRGARFSSVLDQEWILISIPELSTSRPKSSRFLVESQYCFRTEHAHNFSVVSNNIYANVVARNGNNLKNWV